MDVVPAERAYLDSQHLARLGTIGPDGGPLISWQLDPDRLTDARTVGRVPG